MTHTCKVFVAAVVAVGLLILAGSGLARNTGDSLERRFVDPPDSAKPRNGGTGRAETSPGKESRRTSSG